MGMEKLVTSKPSALEQWTVPAWLAAPYKEPKETKNFTLLLLLIPLPAIQQQTQAMPATKHPFHF